LSIPLLQYWRGETLERLRQCRKEIPTSGSQDFESPCTAMLWRRLGLSGISVAQMKATLGPADYCFDGPDAYPRKDPKIKECTLPGWSFFYLPKTGLGGGPNLVCWARNGKTCLVLYWLLTA
jgi:hypothetical protein